MLEDDVTMSGVDEKNDEAIPRPDSATSPASALLEARPPAPLTDPRMRASFPSVAPAPLAPPRAAPRPRRASRGRPPIGSVVVASSDETSSGDASPPPPPFPRPLTAIIVGGGIGGLAACVALRRVGVDARVFERATALDANAGTGIALWPNGLKALRCVGPDVEAEVASRGRVISAMRLGIVDDREKTNASGAASEEKSEEASRGGGASSSLAGRFLAAISSAFASLVGAAAPAALRARHGAGLVCIRWAAVQAALASFLPPEAIVLDAAVASVSAVDRADGSRVVRCAFERRDGSAVPNPTATATGSSALGSPVSGPQDERFFFEADFLVAADGVRSAVREAVLGDGAPRDNGRVIWRGIVDAGSVVEEKDSAGEGSDRRGSNDTSSASSRVGDFSTRRSRTFPSFCPEGATAVKASKDSAVGRTVCYMDVGGGEIYWAAGCLDEGIAGDAAADPRGACRATFAAYPDVLACLDATPPEGFYSSRVLDRPPLTPERANAALEGLPIVLLGDAAHPVIPSFGQGANLALEDAAELAVALAGASQTAAGFDESIFRGSRGKDEGEDATGRGVLARSSPSDPADVSASLVATLRRWEATRLERTSTAQIASFVSGSRSYGEAKFAEAMAESGIPEADLEAHRRAYPSPNDAQNALVGWNPSANEALCDLAPEAAMSLARRAANERRGGGGGAGRRATLAGAAAVFAFGDVWGAREPRGASAAEEEDESKDEASSSTSSASFDSYVGDGFRFDLPRGWTVREDAPGASPRSTGRLGVYPPNAAVAAASVSLEPVFTMGAEGLASLYPSAEAFGDRIAGARRGEVTETRTVDGGAAYVAEGVASFSGGGKGGRATRWVELAACACREGAEAKKYNLARTVRVSSSGGASEDAVAGVRTVVDSFRLTTEAPPCG